MNYYDMHSEDKTEKATANMKTRTQRQKAAAKLEAREHLNVRFKRNFCCILIAYFIHITRFYVLQSSN